MKATGIVRRIDDLGRVVIPKEIRRTMRIREGDPLEIFTDREGELIFKKYSPVGELSDFAAQICGAKKELLGKPVSAAVSAVMDRRSVFRQDSGGSSLPVSSADEQYCLSVAAPVLAEGDVLGCVMYVTPKGSKPASEAEYRVAQTAASFLGKQMED